MQSVQFAGDNIGINGDTDLMVLTSGTLTVDGKVASTTLETSGAATVGGDLTLSNTAAVAITHSGSTSLSISSTNGYVAVESVQFAGANIGINGDPNLMVLGGDGVLTVDGKVASTTLETRGGDCGRRPDAVEHCGSGDHAQRVDVSVDRDGCRLPARRSASTGTRR